LSFSAKVGFGKIGGMTAVGNKSVYQELKQLMKPEEIGSWLLTEMEKFEGRTPADLMSKGETGRLWESLFYLLSGMPDWEGFQRPLIRTPGVSTVPGLQWRKHGALGSLALLTKQGDNERGRTGCKSVGWAEMEFGRVLVLGDSINIHERS
jgi:hypothetical protein